MNCIIHCLSNTRPLLEFCLDTDQCQAEVSNGRLIRGQLCTSSIVIFHIVKVNGLHVKLNGVYFFNPVLHFFTLLIKASDCLLSFYQIFQIISFFSVLLLVDVSLQ